MDSYLTKTGEETGSLAQQQLQGRGVEPTSVGEQEISKGCNLGTMSYSLVAPHYQG